MARILIPHGGSDLVMTPRPFAERIVRHFAPSGLCLEPCRGDGGFYSQLPEPKEWCEILNGVDFFHRTKRCDWIITNPPYSQFRAFLNHSMKLADNIVFLTSINHIWLKARIRDIKREGFGIKEILLCDTPETFPTSGFQIGVVHFSRSYRGSIWFGEI